MQKGSREQVATAKQQVALTSTQGVSLLRQAAAWNLKHHG
jgi:hypothetical protein